MPNPKQISLVQISDCHLFADQDALHFGQPVYQNLLRILQEIAKLEGVDAIIFSGDLSQDHSIVSYRNFVKAFSQAVDEFGLNAPLYWLPGNHDELQLLEQTLVHPLIVHENLIQFDSWQIQLIDSTSPTPSGHVYDEQLDALKQTAQTTKFCMVFMHHTPIEVGFFIDKHGLRHKKQFWEAMNSIVQVKAICSGHVHQGMSFAATAEHQIPVFTCPATSIQFDPTCPTVAALDKGPGYRHFYLNQNGCIETSLHYLSLVK